MNKFIYRIGEKQYECDTEEEIPIDLLNSPDNNTPAIIHKDGTEYYYKNGMRHREDDLPAIVNPRGGKAWYYNDLRHRTNGPARIYPDDDFSSTHRRFFIDGKMLELEEWLKINPNQTPEFQMKMRLQYK